MRRILIIISLLSLLLIGAKGENLRRLTVINKSGTPIAIYLRTPGQLDRVYYLPVPKGDRQMPTEVTFTIVPDEYRMRVYYLEEAPSHTGYECNDSVSSTLWMVRNIRITILECDRRIPNIGDPGMYKVGGVGSGVGCLK